MLREKHIRPRRTPGVVAAVPVLAAVLGLASGCGQGREHPRRIVLITLDTLRYDSLAGSGPHANMPATLGFAQRGLFFERFYSSSATTQPSHASLFTGLHPWQHHVVRNGCVLADEHRTLAEVLHEAGYRTGGVVASFALHSRFGFAQGFERFDDDFSIELDTGKTGWMGHEFEGEFYSLADDVTGRALRMLDGLDGPRQFLWVHYYDPHTPYGDSTEEPIDLADVRAAVKRDPTMGPMALRQARLLYDADVAHMDRALERLLARLEAEAGEIETHVVIVSDHGESFGEANSLGHGNRLTPEQVHVPLVIVSPRVDARSRTDVGGMVDLYATILSLAGRTVEDGVPGRDLLGSTEGSACGMRRLPGRGSVREVQADGTTVVHEGPRFFLVRGDLLLSGNSEELYEGDEGPAELEPAHAAAVRALFHTFASGLEGGDVRALEDEGTVEALKALGYAE